MKKKWLLLIALAAACVVPTVAMAQAPQQIITLGRMKWSRGISSYGLGVLDSTRISIPAAGPSADMTDTTAWLDLGTFRFSQAYAKQPMVMFQITKQLTTTTDSIGFNLQFSNDIGSGSVATPGTLAYITSIAAATAGVSTGGDGIIGTVVAVSADAATALANGTAATLPYRFVRLIVQNSDTSGATGRSYFSVTPIIYGSR